MNKTRVLILGKLPPPYYGPAIATEIILNSCLKEEFNLIYIDTRLNSSMQTMGKFAWYKIFIILKIYLRFMKSLSKPGLKVVLIPIAQETSALMKDAVFILLARLFTKKVLLHLRGSSLLTWYESSYLPTRLFFKWIFSLSSGAIVLGQKLRYIFEPFLHQDKIFVVPNGADFNFPPKLHNGSILSVLYFGNLQASKGIEDVLRAVGMLTKEELQKMELNVVGSWSGPDFEMVCKEIVSQKKLPITFNEPKSGKEKLKMFAYCDVFVFTPRTPEGHPWVIVEAMAAALPVITTDQGAISESIIDGVNGFIVPVGSPEHISARIKQLMENPQQRIEMGRAGRNKYLESFTEKAMTDNLSEVIHQVINQDA